MPKILIVDDTPQNLYYMEVLFQTNGYEVFQASDGLEALESARKDPPDIIVSDILMPKMDGFTLCKTWKSEKQFQGIPFIFYTATYTDDKDRDFALSLGADRFFVKPMQPDDILAAIKQLLEANSLNKLPSQISGSKPDDQFLREYNEVLVRKLEQKMLQLKKTNSRLFSLYLSSTIFSLHKTYDESVGEVLSSLTEKAEYEKAIYYKLENSLICGIEIRGFDAETQRKIRVDLLNQQSMNYGTIGSCIRTKKTINLPTIEKGSDWEGNMEGIKAAIYIPVQYDDQLFGILGLYSSEENNFSEEDEQILFSLTHNLAISISNREIQKQLQVQVNRISSLHQIDMSINSSSDLSITLHILLTCAVSQLGVNAAEIVLLDRFTNQFTIASRTGFLNNFPGETSVSNKIISKISTEQRVMNFVLNDFEISTEWKAEGFQECWGVAIVSKGTVRGVLEVFTRDIKKQIPEWVDYLDTLAGQAAIAIENTETYDNLLNSNLELQMAYDSTIEGWSRALDLRDKETEGHTQRVTEITALFAQKLGIKTASIVDIRRGALLHDIGKIGVPDSILLKPGPLSDDEWVIMKQHPDIANRLLKDIKYLQGALDIPYCHHEKWDGSGYPRGLQGNDIPIAARLFAIIDVWDALSSDRPYRKAWPTEKIFSYIKENSGTHFDPGLVPEFLKLQNKI